MSPPPVTLPPDPRATHTGGAGGRSPSRTRDLGVLALVTIAPLWGYSWVVSKVALNDAGPFTFISLSMSICVVFLFSVLVLTRRTLRPPPLGWILLIGLLQTFLFSGLATLALAAGGAGKVTVLVYTMPFWLLVLAWLFLGERLRGAQWPAVALAFTGLVLVVRPWDIGGALGGLLACASGLAWAAASLVIKLLQRRMPVDAIALAAWQMAFGVVPLILLAALAEGGGPRWTATFVGTVAYTALISNGLCWVLWVLALRSLPAGAAGMGTLAVPVIGVAAAWIHLGEAPALVEGAGMALIVVALAVLGAYGLRAERGRTAMAGAESAAQAVTD